MYSFPGRHREYQVQLVKECIQLIISGAKGVTIQSPMGSGKTRMQAMLVAAMLNGDSDSKVVLTVSSQLILTQLSEALADAGIRHFRLVSSSDVGECDNHNVVVAMAPTLSNRLAKNKLKEWKPDLIIIDEVHRLLGRSKFMVGKWDAPVVGFSATVCRFDGQKIGDVTPYILQGPQPKFLQERGWLAPTATFVMPAIDVKKLKVVTDSFGATEFDEASVVEALEASEYRRLVPHTWKSLMNGRSTVVFVPSVVAGEALEREFRTLGVPTVFICGTTPAPHREATIKLLADKQIHVVVNVNLLVEGTDIPNLECVVDLQPTLSLSKYLQRLGRVIRPHPSKRKGVILDFVGNTNIHGEVDDDRDWLNGGAVVNSFGKRSCFVCTAYNDLMSITCKGCGATHSLQEIANNMMIVPTALQQAISRETPARQCPPWAMKYAETWADIELIRVSRGLPLPDSRTKTEGFTEQTLREAIAEESRRKQESPRRKKGDRLGKSGELNKSGAPSRNEKQDGHRLSSRGRELVGVTRMTA